MAITRQKEFKISKFKELQGYYLQDTWKLFEHPKFIIHPEDRRYQNQKSGGGLTVHFEMCNNENLREELKYWVYHLIEIADREIISLSTDIAKLHRFIKFVNEYKEEMNSLLDITIEDIEIWYKKILLLNGYQVEYNGRFVIDKDMVKHQYKYENSGLAELRKMYVVINEYLRPDLNPIPEYEKDSWDIRNLPFKVELPPARPRYTISFLKIHQDILKKYAKKYIYI